MSDPSQHLTAIHEAGHAVMALLMGRPVQKVSIVPKTRRLGAVTMQKGRSKPTKDLLEADLLILLAGMAAEARCSGKYNLQGAAQDLQMAEKLALHRGGNPKQASKVIGKALDKTNHLLSQEENWAAVKAIAKELLEHQTISGRSAKHHLDLAKRG